MLSLPLEQVKNARGQGCYSVRGASIQAAPAGHLSGCVEPVSPCLHIFPVIVIILSDSFIMSPFLKRLEVNLLPHMLEKLVVW